MLAFEQTRLDSLQEKALSQALKDVEGSIYLFGSRADLNKKGGDVDIMIISDQLYKVHFKKSLKIAVDYLAICDEKIDVIIFPSYDNQNYVQKDFFDHILKKQLQ